MESMGQLASFIFQYLVFSDVQYSRYGDELREKKRYLHKLGRY